MAIPEVLLFDLGGVLVDSAGLRELPGMLAAPMSPEDLRRKWVTSPAVRSFETGRCSSQEFAVAFIEEWRLSIGHGDFLARFTAWAGAPYPETAELLSGLAGRYTLACLSNTNAAHWDSLCRMDDLRPVLERPFTSHKLGLMKPSPEVFARVASDLGHPPGDIAFFDDGPENVDVAARAGLSAHCTVGPVALRNVLRDLGLL
jgi:putative hydrolase of the HAD superfamily